MQRRTQMEPNSCAETASEVANFVENKKLEPSLGSIGLN